MNLPPSGMSEPPIRARPDAHLSRPPTFADVAMKLVNDGPAYALMGLAGTLALTHQATALEAITGCMAALLSKAWPRPVQYMGLGGVLILFAARAIIGPSADVLDALLR